MQSYFIVQNHSRIIDYETVLCDIWIFMFLFPGRYWEMVERLKVTHLYTAPTAIRLLLRHEKEWVTKYDRSSLRILGCGESKRVWSGQNWTSLDRVTSTGTQAKVCGPELLMLWQLYKSQLVLNSGCPVVWVVFKSSFFYLSLSL